jgi:threonine aldolase
MSDIVDLRSDTITKPTQAMREAMYQAEVGDDVFGEDPTVNALQTKAAEMLGMEAALFVPSGTMANQLAVWSQTRPATEVILETDAHIFRYEAAAASVISSVQIKTITGDRGRLSADQVEPAIRPDIDPHQPPTVMICLENTSNRGGGSVYTEPAVAAMRELADRYNIRLHMDGARLFNACAATGNSPHDYTRHCHSVSFCLSKALGAPVGSLLVSDNETIYKAWRGRKMFGGGMRQAGILAAAGMYALDHHVDRLAEDHDHAKILAQAIAETNGLEINPDHVESNIVIFNVTKPNLTAADLAGRLREHGVLVLDFGPQSIRAVTSLEVDRNGIDRAVSAINKVMNA